MHILIADKYLDVAGDVIFKSILRTFKRIVLRFKSIPYAAAYVLPLLMLIYFHGSVEKKWGITIAAAWLVYAVTALIFGRAFCGFMCEAGVLQRFYGLLGEVFIRRNIKVSEKLDKRLRSVKYLFLIILLGFSVIKLTLLLDCSMTIEQYPQVGRILGVAEHIVEYMIAGMLGAAIIGSFLLNAFWCKYFCLKGAMLGCISKASTHKISLDKNKCNGCEMCVRNCPMNIKIYEAEVKMPVECLRCQQCVAVCPKKALSNSVFGVKLSPIRYIAASTATYILAFIIISFLT